MAKLQCTSTVTSNYVHRLLRSAANTEWNTKPTMFNFYAWHIVQALGATAHVVLCRLVFVSLNVSDGGQIDYPRSAPFVFLLTDSIQLLIIPGSISCIWSHFYIIIFFHLVTRSQDELYFLVAELWRTISLYCKSAVVISFRHIAQNSFSCTSPIHIGFHPTS